MNLLTEAQNTYKIYKLIHIVGDVPKRLKGPDSKSGRSASPARGFKSPRLRF